MDFLISNAYAQAAAPADNIGLLGSPIVFIIVMAAMMFFMFRSQSKRQKELKSMIAALAKGDEVVTNGGIVGKITKVTDAYVGVEIAEGTEITIQKAAVSTILPKGTIKSL